MSFLAWNDLELEVVPVHRIRHPSTRFHLKWELSVKEFTQRSHWQQNCSNCHRAKNSARTAADFYD